MTDKPFSQDGEIPADIAEGLVDYIESEDKGRFVNRPPTNHPIPD